MSASAAMAKAEETVMEPQFEGFSGKNVFYDPFARRTLHWHRTSGGIRGMALRRLDHEGLSPS